MKLLKYYNTEISILPSTQSASTDETFNVSVYCNLIQPIKSFEFDLDYNASLIQVNSVNEGDIFSSYSTFFNNGIIDNINGYINNIYSLILTDSY